MSSVPVASKRTAYEQAVKLVLDRQLASVALIQRSLRLGYSNAKTLLEDMAKAGIVSHDIGDDGFRVISDHYARPVCILANQEDKDLF